MPLLPKQPEIQTLSDGYNQKHKLNQNFKSIQDKFETVLQRTAFTPNYMDVNLDIADANITNVLSVQVESISVLDEPFTSLSDYYVYRLGLLNCNEGDIITHDTDGDPTCLVPGAEGEVLKTIGSTVAWAEDLDTDTDTDTVGVTIQEDGVTVATNVTEINFELAGKTFATVPTAAQVDLALAELIGPFFQDTDQADTNLDPDDANFADANQVTRLDIVNDAGVSIPTTDNEYYVVAEASNYFESTGPVPTAGVWSLGVRFYDSTGTATSLTGNQLTTPGFEDDLASATNNDGGALLWVFCGVPADTQYIDFGWGLIPTIAISLQTVDFSDRYRALVPASARDTFQTPQGNGYPTGQAAQITDP